MNETILIKYAELAVKMGVNLQKNQTLMLTAPVECAELIRAITKVAYSVGAMKVIVNWKDDLISRAHYEGQSIETLTDIRQFEIDAKAFPMEEGAALISVASPTPDVFVGIDSDKLSKAAMANGKAFEKVQSYTMNNINRWCIIAAPNPLWAKKVFPNEASDVAMEKLWDKILSAVHVSLDNDPMAEWNKHNSLLNSRVNELCKLNFKSLHFTNELGTDLVVGLPLNHVWAGGSELDANGICFNANMPSEEIFTAPSKYEVNGRVVATKPLDYQGEIIDGFEMTFKEGKVVSYSAKKGAGALARLVEYDEGSCYLGEAALVEHSSPISQSNILFYNTLFDENASCHLALGRAYPTCVKGGEEMNKDELEKAAINTSLAHVDFMFGNETMKIVGTTYGGSEVIVFENGNFIL